MPERFQKDFQKEKSRDSGNDESGRPRDNQKRK